MFFIRGDPFLKTSGEILPTTGRLARRRVEHCTSMRRGDEAQQNHFDFIILIFGSAKAGGLSSDLSDDFGGSADGDGEVRDVVCDDGVGPDDTGFADVDIGEDDDAEANPGAVADGDFGIVVADEGADFGITDVIKGMGDVHDRTSGSDGYIGADRDVVMASDVDVLFNVDVVSDDEARSSVGIGDDDFKAGTFGKEAVRTDMHVLGVV